MNVFVSGATGVLGKRLVELLADRGHDVSGLVRDEDGERTVERRGGEPRRGDVLDAASLGGAVPDDVDVVVHAATAIPTSDKPSNEEWELNDRVRIEGAKNLVATAGRSADRFVFPSVVWVARQHDGSKFDESAERHPDRATRSAAETEDYLREAGDEHGFDVLILRNGMFYEPDGAYTRTFAENLLEGDMPIIGGGLLGRRDVELSLIHADDAARAFADAIEAEVTGLYHVVDEESVTLADYLTHFADLLDAPEPGRIPGWLARFFVGKEAVNMLSKPMPTTAEAFRADVGWEPEYPTYREGLDQVVETWEADGTLAQLNSGERAGDSDAETTVEKAA
ncbi:Nucleoside-diphosphate-sugar epimerase [Halomicrobium zhouii]|uniref:Nucleoside-diphosphate-sugar epimerase n=1 Tax=Halomicrobium zhouii TaxID=767519 RepID=A0A1I6KRY2_9EURY|nr:NAD(P)-dependent oxidoreductase [Halomicrobium zhouii]SFR93788.1 Nucleoside-diphosphate-sugar epimerase [Halomicrobium zhouii]